MRRRKWNEVGNVSVLRVFAVSFVAFALVSPVFVLGSLAADGEDVAVSSINEAENSVGLAYEAVLEAEEAGANVSSLLAGLNAAGDCLARAHLALRKGDFAGVIAHANHSIEIAEEVEADASELKKLAPQQRRQHLLFSMMRSTIAMGGIGVGSVISWREFKRRYSRRISGKKPEVNVDGA